MSKPATKDMKTTEYPDVKAMDPRFMDDHSQSISINWLFLKIRSLSQLSWLTRFKQHHSGQQNVICGESKDTPANDNAQWETGTVSTNLSTYKPEDIFYCEKIGFFFHI